MKLKFVYLFIVGIVLMSSSFVFGQPKLDVASVKWMTGCWELKNEKKNTLTLEQWTTSDGGILFGIGRTLKAGKLVSWEIMRIEQDQESAKFSAQLPGADKATSFALKSATASEVIFENLQNDFPHRVIYKNAGSTKIGARIEGKINDKDQAIDFSFNRIECK